MMPIKKFLAQIHTLYTILDSADIPEKEKRLRKERIYSAAKKAEQEDSLRCADEFFQRAHEINSLKFLSNFGSVHMSLDSDHEKGADFTLNESLSIECVCATFGDNIDESGLHRYLIQNKVIDYNEKKHLLNARFTNSLHAKVAFYEQRCGKSIPKNHPYIIFLSLGRLSLEWFAEEYGIALTDILFGRGNPFITVDFSSRTVIANGYTHINTFKKYNGKDIDGNLFLDPSFTCVSGVFLATEADGPYTSQNTFLFLNPFSTLKLDPLAFPGIVYWDIYGKDSYAPYQNGTPLTTI